MKIPADKSSRQMLYATVAEACLATRYDRKDEYAIRESYYLNGNARGEAPAEINKIEPAIKNLKAFIYAADSTNFTANLGVQVPPKELAKVGVTSRYFNQEWMAANNDEVASQCVEWSLVYNTMIMKSLWENGHCRAYAVRPHDFGVYNESITTLDDQEALAHCYTVGWEEFRRRIDFLPNAKAILDNVTPQKGADATEGDGVSRLILTASAPITPANPNASGALSNTALMSAPNYDAKTDIEVVELVELWVWNDDKEDYQIVTMAGPIPIVDRQASDMVRGQVMFPKGENPFTAFTPNKKYNYFWGTSDVARVISLQMSQVKLVNDFDNLLEKQVRPPVSGYGYTDEQMLALQSIGGIATANDPNAAAQLHPPEIPDEVFKRFDMIDEGFADALALHNILQGKGEPGVRGRGHAQELARISSSRIKEKALSVEDSLEKTATLQLRLMQVYDETKLHDEEGKAFVLAQFPFESTVKVDAHSNSPLFTDDTKDLAFQLLEAEVIDGETLVDMVKPQNAELVKLKYKALKKEKEAAMLAQATGSEGAGPAH